MFDKNTFKYITSTGFIGKGPGEIIVPGRLGIDKKNKIFWVPDHGKQIMYKFPLDSVLNNKTFKPTIKKELHNNLFLARFGFLNDSIALGKAVHATSISSFEMAMAKLNINTNITEKFGFENPKAVGKKSNSVFALSIDNNFYVNCYMLCDLMTICDLKGNLEYNIYGPGWFDKEQDKKDYFNDVDLISNKIIASYTGEKSWVIKGNITKSNEPSKFIVFDNKGNYLKTIECGFEFSNFCIDEKNKRIIAFFVDREEPLGYFDISFLYE